ncbi:ABC transporter permease [Paraprevotella clara]|uniref:Efflux ABC transporter, permease protein n=1 Tax=Paraprevotella clara YIT 11840 TaxID=762968 RepID=G5SLK6_9BACT|nr:ABC transporter permease [Paraprevotella clara]EHH01772.1 efflux ABC transporter, permease protein [Paraprevotella clara YIT 11840]
MKMILIYIRNAARSAWDDKLYSTFYILGMAVAFMLIILLFTAVRLVRSDAQPFVNAENMIRLETWFTDKNGNEIGGIETQDIERFVSALPGTTGYSISNTEEILVFANGKVRVANVGFVRDSHFEINEFDFISGRPFTENAVPQAVIAKSFADRSFPGNPLGEKITIQKQEYTIVGVVRDFSSLQNPFEKAVIWVSDKYNQFLPSYEECYSINILFDQNMLPHDMQENLIHALTQYYRIKGIDANIKKDNVLTLQEAKYKYVGGSTFNYGAVAILLLLILIPALNIMTLSSAKVYAMATEIAIKRALGATKQQAFGQIISENILLSLVGFIFAVILVKPVMALIDGMLSTSGNTISVLSGFSLDITVLALTLVMALLFALISGGIPAYHTVVRNIAVELKGRDL